MTRVVNRAKLSQKGERLVPPAGPQGSYSRRHIPQTLCLRRIPLWTPRGRTRQIDYVNIANDIIVDLLETLSAVKSAKVVAASPCRGTTVETLHGLFPQALVYSDYTGA